MKSMLGFTIGGMLMLSIVVVAALSAISSFGFSSEKSIAKEVDSTLSNKSEIR